MDNSKGQHQQKPESMSYFPQDDQLQQRPQDYAADSSLSLALLLDRRFSLPNARFMAPIDTSAMSYQQFQQFTPGPQSAANPSAEMDMSLDFSRRLSYQPISMTDMMSTSPISSAVSLNSQAAEYNRRMPFALYPNDMILAPVQTPRTPSPVDYMNQFDMMQHSNYVFPPIPQKSRSLDVSSLQQSILAPSDQPFYFSQFQTSASAPVSPIYVSSLGKSQDIILEEPEETVDSAPNSPAETPKVSKPEANGVSFPNSYKISPLLASGGLFGKTPEPGFDILMASPPTSPANLIHARRNSMTDTNRPARFKPTEAELVMLTAIFQKNPFPSASLRQKLAERMGLDIKQVQFWFQNRRATMKISGIHVLKPKRGNNASMDKKRTSMSPLSKDSPYFYVKEGAAVKPPPITLQFS